jgi:hypothetical protein
MQNSIILLVAGVVAGALFASTLGSGIYQSVTLSDRALIGQTNTQTGAIRLCAPVSHDFGDPRRGPNVEQYFVNCTDWYEKN